MVRDFLGPFQTLFIFMHFLTHKSLRNFVFFPHFARKPKKDSHISQYAMLYHDGGFLLFGGVTEGLVDNDFTTTDTVARLDAKLKFWSLVSGVSKYS